MAFLFVPPDPWWLGVCLKPVPVLMLALVQLWAAAGGTRAGGSHGWFALGLFCSAAGDVWLAWPGDHFIAGLLAFLLAHVAYIVAFLTLRSALLPLRALPFFVYGVCMVVLLAPGLGALAAPVGIYALAITIMGWRAASLLGAVPPLASLLALGGALSFAASDSLLAIDRFYAPLGPYAHLAVMLTYWAGQAGIALSAVVDE